MSSTCSLTVFPQVSGYSHHQPSPQMIELDECYKLMIVFWIVLVSSSQSVKTRPEVKTEVNLHGRQLNIVIDVIVKAEELLRLCRCGTHW